MTTKARITDRYDRANLECACLIAADPTLHPEGGLMQRWADVVLSRAAAQPDESEAGPLFAATANRRAA